MIEMTIGFVLKTLSRLSFNCAIQICKIIENLRVRSSCVTKIISKEHQSTSVLYIHQRGSKQEGRTEQKTWKEF